MRCIRYIRFRKAPTYHQRKTNKRTGLRSFYRPVYVGAFHYRVCTVYVCAVVSDTMLGVSSPAVAGCALFTLSRLVCVRLT